jgi:hypothetical protein
MAEINQPAPVKPVWPSRREQQPSKRNPSDHSNEGDQKKRKEARDLDIEKPGIDEYV